MQTQTVMATWDGVKVFTATMHKDREVLGEKISQWLKSLHTEGGEVTSTVVTQSSDSEFHCLTITVFYIWKK